MVKQHRLLSVLLVVGLVVGAVLAAYYWLHLPDMVGAFILLLAFGGYEIDKISNKLDALGNKLDALNESVAAVGESLDELSAKDD